MKVILSRKGFDSDFGGFPSPVLPDGRLLSLPIPSPNDKHKYQDLKLNKNKNYQQLMRELGIKCSSQTCHLDPDIYPDCIKRETGWLPIFGQVGAAAGHLDNQGVGEGDLFLFFGWFQKTVKSEKRLIFDKSDKGKHIIFGYLQVAKKISVGVGEVPTWALYHPHLSGSSFGKTNNTIYIASKTLSWNPKLPGAGVFKFHDDLVLSKDGLKRSIWQLPDFFRNLVVSYHTDKSWQGDGFKAASRGQEFVIECNDQLLRWVDDKIRVGLL